MEGSTKSAFHCSLCTMMTSSMINFDYQWSFFSNSLIFAQITEMETGGTEISTILQNLHCAFRSLWYSDILVFLSLDGARYTCTRYICPIGSSGGRGKGSKPINWPPHVLLSSNTLSRHPQVICVVISDFRAKISNWNTDRTINVTKQTNDWENNWKLNWKKYIITRLWWIFKFCRQYRDYSM